MSNGLDIGIGVSMATGSPMALGAKGAITPPEVGPGVSGAFTFRRVDSTADLTEELGIGVDASGGIGLFRGSASFDFSKRVRIQSSSLTVMVTASRTLAFRQMDSPELSETASRFIRDGQTARFAEQFGDYFVRGISSGGRFIGVVRIDTRSETAKTDVNLALSASYGLTMSAEARVNVSNALARASATAEAFITFEGGTVLTSPTSHDPVELLHQLYKAMDEWTRTVTEQPMAYSVTLAPYAVALGPDPPNVADLEKQRDVLIRCAKLRLQIIDRLNLVDHILDPLHTREYTIVAPPSGPDLPALQAALAGDLDVISEAASFAMDNLREAMQPEEFMRVKKGVPDFRFTPLPANMPEHTGGSAQDSDPIAVALKQITTGDPTAAPFFAVPMGGGLDRPEAGPEGGRFVIFASNLREHVRIVGSQVITEHVFGPTGGIFSLPDGTTHYVYGRIFQDYECRYGLCFGHAGFSMGYPTGNQILTSLDGVPSRVQRFQHGSICPEMGDLNTVGDFVNPLPNGVPCFVWNGRP